MDKKKKCQYGQDCYRQNPSHLEEYDHGVTKRQEQHSTKRVKVSDSPKKFKQAKLCFQPKQPTNNRKPEVKQPSPRIKPKPVSPKKKPAENESSDESDANASNACDVTSTSWTFQRNSPKSDDEGSSDSDQSDSESDIPNDCKTPAQAIKFLFLVEMPPEFYSFYAFCESHNSEAPYKVFAPYGLQLVGPFDVLSGKLNRDNVTREQALCHWRFFMDPPEMQTILVAEKGLHYAYWRDDPKAEDCFIVANTVPSCTIQAVAATVFGAVAIHMEGYLRNCSPFDKVKANSILSSLRKWAEEKNIDLSDCKDSMRARKKKVVASTFHELGIVVEVQPKTEIGYRPLIETNANLKKICNGIIRASNTSGTSKKMEAVDKLVNAANIANDEGDFGNALELGIDLFCMGSDIFHNHVKHLLSTAYILLNRPEWAKVIKAHLKNRRTGLQLSVVKNK